MIQRTHFQVIMKRIEEPRRYIQVIFGPRQVGKTTTLEQVTNIIKIQVYATNADGVTNANWLETQWEIARLKMKQADSPEILFIVDEIQKIDNWSETVKKLWDKDTKDKINLKVILLGSSRLMIQQGLTESLAGRFETIYMGHWSFTEMLDAFGWTARQYAWFGGYPGAAWLIDDEERWKSYITDSLIETSISKDILMLTRVDKPALMKRLFQLGCLYSGQELSFTKIMGHLQDAGNTTTLSHYLKLLDTAGLLGGLEKYTRDVDRKRASIPKFMVHNTALISAQSEELIADVFAKPDKWGRVVESAIGAHLLNQSITGKYNVYYWRHVNYEVDFVIAKNEKIIAIEVKSGNTSANKGMAAFKKQFDPQKTLLVGNAGLPWEEFISINPVELF